MGKLAIGLITVLAVCISLAQGTAYAGDSFTYTVTCTIPAIPGVNAPLIEEQSTRTTDADAYAEQEKGSPEEEEHGYAREESGRQTLLAINQERDVTVKTIYER